MSAVLSTSLPSPNPRSVPSLPLPPPLSSLYFSRLLRNSLPPPRSDRCHLPPLDLTSAISLLWIWPTLSPHESISQLSKTKHRRHGTTRAQTLARASEGYGDLNASCSVPWPDGMESLVLASSYFVSPRLSLLFSAAGFCGLPDSVPPPLAQAASTSSAAHKGPRRSRLFVSAAVAPRGS